MRKIYTGFVSDPSIQQPLTTKSLDFLHGGQSQMVYAICKSIIQNSGRTYSTSVPYLFSSDSNAGFTSDGVVFFNGELYVMTENTGGLAYAIVDTTPDPIADPVTFSDSVARDVHNNRYLTYQASSVGALFAVVDIVSVNVPNTTIIPSFSNTWLSSITPRYSKGANGMVTLDGVVHKTGVINSGNQLIVTLPSGFRPTSDRAFSVFLNDSPDKKNGIVYVGSNGEVKIELAQITHSTDTFVSFDGISFYTD